MKNKNYFSLIGIALIWVINPAAMKAQPEIENSFFESVDYAGAFGTEDWTDGWANWTPQTTAYPATTEVLPAGDITANTTLTADKVYLLDGWVYVKEGATLTIEPGTVIRGSKANKGALIIQKGAKIIAEGTPENPIVFTSNQDTSSRSYGDWGGLIVLGKALVNKVDPIIEGGPTSTYGGSDDEDNSGILKYVRIEFPGIAFQPDKEINGLTLGGVGSGTEVDYVQVSYSGDDSYEWFGGAVNARHLIAFRGWDDDFDTDYGYRGMVQFAVSLRDPDVADAGSGSNSFESDNDGGGTDDTPITQALFSNVSSFGPLATTSATVNPNFKRAILLRKNTRLNIYNSIFAGYLTGLFIDGSASQTNAANGDLKVRNTFLAGCGDFFSADFDSTYFIQAANENATLAENTDLEINDPFNLEAPDFLPMTGSVVLTASSWYEEVPTGNGELSVNAISASIYPNPFSEYAGLSIELDSESNVSVLLYDVTGTMISTVMNERRPAGKHEFTIRVPQQGVYFADIKVNEVRQVLKLVSR